MLRCYAIFLLFKNVSCIFKNTHNIEHYVKALKPEVRTVSQVSNAVKGESNHGRKQHAEKNLVTFGHLLFEICSHQDIETHQVTDCNSLYCH